MNHLSVPYFKQDEENTCGPTVLRMAASFFGMDFSQEKLKSLAMSEEEDYTRNSDLVTTAKRLGFKVSVKQNASIQDIEKHLKNGRPVIVNFIEADNAVPLVDFVSAEDPVTGHFATVIGLDKKNIYFNDPLYGPKYSLPVSQFLSLWKSGFENYERWLMALSPKRRSLKEYFGYVTSSLPLVPSFVRVRSDSRDDI